jgi:hypothetical protein
VVAVGSQDDLDLRVLEYVYDHDQGMLREPAGLSGLYDVAGSEDAGLQTAADLRRRGLISADQRLSGGYHIEPEGKRIVEEFRARRSDRGYRRQQCREQLLRWADSDDRRARRDFDGSAHGQPFTMEESETAAGFLAENGLLKTFSAAQEKHYLVQITERGRECIDSGKTIQQFVSRHDLAAQMVNVFGSGNSVAAAFGDGSAATASLSTFDHEMAITFASSVREALPVLTLPDEADGLLDDIEQREDPGLAQRATAKLYTLIGDTTSGALGGVLGAMGAGALGIGS